MFEQILETSKYIKVKVSNKMSLKKQLEFVLHLTFFGKLLVLPPILDRCIFIRAAYFLQVPGLPTKNETSEIIYI